MLSKKEQAQEWMRSHRQIQLKCIHCHNPLRLQETSLICKHHHRFDLSRQGYVFLSRTASDSQYGSELFKLRREIITQTPFYTKFHHLLSTIINQYQPESILDAGSGEGSHLNQCKNFLNHQISLVGVDLSKEGIQLSTDYNQDQLNLVADLSQLPFTDNSFDMILSILSPANYQEFNRVMTRNAKLIKVIPNPNYLQEIRQAMADLNLLQGDQYSNIEVLEVFKKHYPKYDKILLQDQVSLSPYHRYCLANMTPLTWKLKPDQMQLVIDRLPETVSLDLTVLIAEK